jgi:RNA polymerase sigma-70 factor, ECF subfamily
MMSVVTGQACEFETWVVAEHRRVFGLCRRLLDDSFEADSATQDVFMKAHRALASTAGLRDPARWLTRVAVNTCLDRLRSTGWKLWRRRPNRASEDLILGMRPDAGPTAEDRLFAEQIAQRLNQAMAKLSLRQRAVFVLRYYDDRSLDEIATVLQLDVGTVKAHQARAVAKLREELRDLYESSRTRWIKPTVAAVIMIVLAVLLIGPRPGPPLLAQRDSRLLNDIYQVLQSPEPRAATPIRALFEEK